jgi:hypothetical protein
MTDGGERRAVQLAQEACRSPSLGNIAHHYHWLEMSLSEQIIMLEKCGKLESDTISLEAFAALQFAQMAVEVHQLLSSVGKVALSGRIRDALKAENLPTTLPRHNFPSTVG